MSHTKIEADRFVLSAVVHLLCTNVLTLSYFVWSCPVNPDMIMLRGIQAGGSLMALSSSYPTVLPPPPVHGPLGSQRGLFIYSSNSFSLDYFPTLFTAQIPPPNSVRFKVELLFLVIVCFCI